jgi:Carboxypeptidase regulatory-like domain
VVRERSAKPSFVGSIPTRASNGSAEERITVKSCRIEKKDYKVEIVEPMTIPTHTNSLPGCIRRLAIASAGVARLSLLVLSCVFSAPVFGQSQQPPASPAAQGTQPVVPTGTGAAAASQLPDPQASGSVSGTVVDPSGALVSKATVKLKLQDQSPSQEVLTNDNGQFAFFHIAPGPFQLTVTSEGFTTQTISGVLHPGEAYAVPQIAMVIATDVEQVRVTVPTVEVAEDEIKAQEQQRVLGLIPNFYVSYIPDAAPLDTKQKFQLAWRDTYDPVRFVLVAAAAGVEQAADEFHGYGQGASGYGQRYGAAYGDFVTSTFIGSAILPAILKQDPRYFYKGKGSTPSRILYALANVVICKGDNGKWQPNYSLVAGEFAAAGISNAYYPSGDRGVGLTFGNAGIGLGEEAAANLLQEFIIRKLTPHLPNYNNPPNP